MFVTQYMMLALTQAYEQLDMKGGVETAELPARGLIAQLHLNVCSTLSAAGMHVAAIEQAKAGNFEIIT